MRWLILLLLIPSVLAITPGEPVVSADSAVIRWQTEAPASSVVSYGTEALETELRDETLVTDHSVEIPNLLPGTTYYYTMSSCADECEKSEQYTFTTGSVAISDIGVEVGKTVRITWTTDAPAGSVVMYGLTNLNDSVSDNAPVVRHSVELSGLLGGMEYSFKVRSGTTESKIMKFNTTEEDSDFIVMDSVPNLVNTNTVQIKGATRPNSRIMIFVNRYVSPRAQVDSRVAGSFDEAVTLSSARTVEGVVGYNEIDVYSWDPDGKRDKQSFVVVLDMMPPMLDVGDIPSPTRAEVVNITGRTDGDAAVEITLDGASQGIIPVTDGSFLHALNIGAEGNHSVIVAARDAAGNENKQAFGVAVDRTAPRIIEISSEHETHFKIYKVKGRVDEPGAVVTVKNIGDYSNYEEFQRRGYNASRTGSIADPTGLVLGKENSDAADKNGKFEVTVPLFNTQAGQELLNNLIITVADAAGNSYQDRQAVLYKPGCPDWHVGKVEANPFNVYTENWHAGDIRGSAFIPIEYVGFGSPENVNRRVSVNIDTSKGDGHMVRLGAVKSPYVEQKKTSYVYVPITLVQTNLPAAELPDEVEVYLRAQMSYTVDGQTATCEVYPEVVFDVQKPIDYAEWLTPSMINESIKALNKTIQWTETLYNHVKEIAKWNSIGCAGYTAYKLLSGFFDKDAACDEKLYYVCDRVMCPYQPAEVSGNTFTQFGSGWERDIGANTKQQVLFVEPDAPTTSREEQRAFEECRRTNQGINDNAQLVLFRQVEHSEGIISTRTTSTDTHYECINDRNTFDPTSNMQKLNAELGGYSEECPQYDQTKCFGQFRKTGVDPAGGLISSMRCGCWPGLQGHLSNYLTIQKGMRQCLQQAMIGETQGGMCERLFAQFVCDISYEIFQNVFPEISAPAIPGIRGNVQDQARASSQIQDNLKDRYGGVLQSRMGLSTDELVHRTCVSAISGDWSVLEESLEMFVDSVPIEPVVHIQGEARPYGHDPFTGKMTIGYNLYLGVIPGGRTEIEMWLECDRNYGKGGGEMCGANVPKLYITGIPTSMDRGDLFNQNINFNDQNAIWWYNKMVLRVKYEMGAGPTQRTVEKTFDNSVNKKGDIGFGCKFSLIGGISCESIMDDAGIVELYSFSNADVRASRMSPSVDMYFPGNKINVLAMLRNDYSEDFYLRITATNTDGAEKSIEYKVPKRKYPNQEVTMNLLVDELDVVKTVSGAMFTGSKKYSTPITVKTLSGQTTQPVTLTLVTETEEITCSLAASGSAGGEWKKCHDGDVKTVKEIRAEGSASGSVPIKYTDAEDKVIMDSVPFTGKTDDITGGTWTLKLDVLKDTNNDGGGDTPILYDTDDQAKSIPITVARTNADGSRNPVVEIIEPVGSYFPNAGPVPIGVNVLDDANQLESLELRIDEKGRMTNTGICSITVTKAAATWTGGSSAYFTLVNPPQPGRPGTGTAPFFGFSLDPNAIPGFDRSKEYVLTAIARDGQGGNANANEFQKSFAFDQGDLRIEDVRVCQGSDCSGTGYGHPRTVQQT
ncbi:MAG: fibronectin type III domain-containing protein [archaeon]